MKRFTVTEDHLKLLRASWVLWDDSEFGAPEIDPKRPYGNSSVIADIAEILGMEGVDKDEPRLRVLHRGTETALQIALATGQFKAGEYEADTYGKNWREVKNS